MNYEARFGGIGRLYGNSGLSLLRSARIAVVGIGGVGSWAAEALARSGVGTIILMDMDDLCITNTNRQIHALASTIGQSKTETMATRIREINPEAEVIPISNFYTASNAEKLLSAEPDVIIDAIDSLIPKAHLIASCYRSKQPLVTCGGAGGRINPARIEIDDLSRTRGIPCSPAYATG
nr:tRNA threonylcarbamoyladenosine dehydratase [Akkermansia muciniphila]